MQTTEECPKPWFAVHQNLRRRKTAKAHIVECRGEMHSKVATLCGVGGNEAPELYNPLDFERVSDDDPRPRCGSCRKILAKREAAAKVVLPCKVPDGYVAKQTPWGLERVRCSTHGAWLRSTDGLCNIGSPWRQGPPKCECEPEVYGPYGSNGHATWCPMATDEMRLQVLEEEGYGNHPDAVKLRAKIAAEVKA